MRVYKSSRLQGPRNIFWSILALATAIFLLALSASAQTEKILHIFSGRADGSYPNSGVIFDSSGNLYGATEEGGDPDSCLGSGCGVVYKLSPTHNGPWHPAELFLFKDTATGASPLGNLAFDASGNLFGAVYAGGGAYACYQGNVDGCGMIVKLSPGTGQWKESVVRDFTPVVGGWIPNGGLVADASGNLYGTTQDGGSLNNDCDYEGCGVAFELLPTSSGGWRESLLHTFTEGIDGGFPDGPLVIDAAGNLYGTASSGGAGSACYSEGCGVAFELSRTAGGFWKETLLHTFTGGADGSFPFGGLAFDSAGNLYGTTFRGGNLSGCDSLGCGVVFELSTISGGGWKETVLYSFTGGSDGAQPDGGLVLDSAGNIYGATPTGGDLSCPFSSKGCGVIFKLSPTSNGTWDETVLHTFEDGSDGADPNSPLTLDATGNLFGTTRAGGSPACDFGYGCGMVFEIIP
jgi:hypothetical protein